LKRNAQATEIAGPNEAESTQVSLVNPASLKNEATRNPDDFCKKQAKDGGAMLNRTGFFHQPQNPQTNPSPQNSRGDQFKAVEPVAKERSASGRSTIVPKISVVSSPPFWSGESVVTIIISLQEVKDNQRWIYRPQQAISFVLEPRNASFAPAIIRIPRGEDHSEPTTLTSTQTGIVQVTCIPDRAYEGLAIQNAEPAPIQFLEPIDRIGLEPVEGKSQVNIATLFEVFLYNHKDPKTKLRPASAISVQLASENGNGSVAEEVVQLTNQDFSKLVHYVGTKTGRDRVVALAHYENRPLGGKSERQILFPLWIFLSGLVGSVVGSLVRSLISDSPKRGRVFLESFVFGLIFCFIVILFPLGTRLPHISNFLQPLLILALAALVSSLGPEFLKLLLSFVPARS
jgi:hypothetical protein